MEKSFSNQYFLEFNKTTELINEGQNPINSRIGKISHVSKTTTPTFKLVWFYMGFVRNKAYILLYYF